MANRSDTPGVSAHFAMITVVLAGLVAMAGAGVVTAPLAAASGTAKSGTAKSGTAEWQRVASPNPKAGGFGNALTGVDCPTAQRCFAVGSAGNRGLVVALRGGRWRLESATVKGGTAKLSSISCSAATFCIAVGYSDSGFRGLRFDGHAWSTSTPAGVKSDLASLNGVSCPTSRECWAVGQNNSNAYGYVPLVERYKGGHWHLRSAGVTTGGVLNAVSCVSDADCWAVGSSWRSKDESTSGPLVEHWNGRSWRSASAPGIGGDSGLQGVSCTSERSCYADGNVTHPPAALAGQPFIEHYNGKSWSIVDREKRYGYGADMTGIWCGGAHNCVAVGDVIADAGGDTSSYLLEQRASGWRRAAAIEPKPAHIPGLSAVACASSRPRDCYAVGSYNPGVASHLATLILRRAHLASPAHVAARSAVKRCRLPAAGQAFGTATPAQEQLDAGKLQQAVDELSLHNRTSVQVFRNNCLVAGDHLNALTGTTHNDLFSVTKSITSMLAGIAMSEGKLRMSARIGHYLPHGPGWGDAAHRAITVHELLTQTSGIDEAILSEAASTGTDPNLAREALAQPIERRPGTHFEYSQLGPALMAFVVQRAVGVNLATFAQRVLFGPIGITPGTWFWLEDRAGTPYGYSNLFLTPAQMARLGLLMQNRGRWNGRQVVPAGYVAKVSVPNPTNGCYGLLFWTNRGRPCTGANIPAAETVHRRAVPSAPADMYQMNGTGGQLNLMIPSLHMTVTTTGWFGDTYPDPSIVLGATPGNMQYDFFRALMKSMQDIRYRDPGPYPGGKLDLDLNPLNFLDPRVVARDLVTNPDCNVLVCDGSVPTKGLIDAVRAAPGLL
ncbi:MAG TPA: serine hydrolase [Mycobacteriales bacterium]|nr:serine hydrolase [Mycobacteriales bacterium]